MLLSCSFSVDPELFQNLNCFVYSSFQKREPLPHQYRFSCLKYQFLWCSSWNHYCLKAYYLVRYFILRSFIIVAPLKVAEYLANISFDNLNQYLKVSSYWLCYYLFSCHNLLQFLKLVYFLDFRQYFDSINLNSSDSKILLILCLCHQQISTRIESTTVNNFA
jgi:hypothetical protein